MSGVLLLIVLIGFSPTLYLRPFLAVPPIPGSVLLHGIVLTAWFVVVLLQSALVAAHRTDIHRRLGWIGAGLGVATLVLSLAVTFMAVPRMYALNPSGLPTISRLFWANLAALLSFAIFLPAAVACRRRPDTHKRLMLLAAISVVQPAMARIRQLWLPGLDGGVFALVWLSLLVVALGVHDLRADRRLHPVTMMGGAFFLGLRAASLYALAPSQAGLTFVRGLVD